MIRPIIVDTVLDKIINGNSCTIKVGDNMIPVILDSTTLILNGVSIGAAFYNNGYTIVLDPMIYKNPFVIKEVKQFFLMHEIGHVVHDDISKQKSDTTLLQKRIEIIKKGGVIQMELNADAYAYRKLGYKVAIKALTYVKTLTKMQARQTTGSQKELLLLSAKEMDNRIDAIKELHKKRKAA